MLKILVKGMMPSRPTPKIMEIAHYLLNRARIEFAKDANGAASLIEKEVHQTFGYDIDLEYVDKKGVPICPEYSDNFVIIFKDQYNRPYQ